MIWGFGEAHYNAIDVDYAFGHDPAALIEPTGATIVAMFGLILAAAAALRAGTRRAGRSRPS